MALYTYRSTWNNTIFLYIFKLYMLKLMKVSNFSLDLVLNSGRVFWLEFRLGLTYVFIYNMYSDSVFV